MSCGLAQEQEDHLSRLNLALDSSLAVRDVLGPSPMDVSDGIRSPDSTGYTSHTSCSENDSSCMTGSKALFPGDTLFWYLAKILEITTVTGQLKRVIPRGSISMVITLHSEIFGQV